MRSMLSQHSKHACVGLMNANAITCITTAAGWVVHVNSMIVTLSV